MLLQIHLVRNNVLGFGFLTPHEEYPDKLDGYSTLCLEHGNSMICQGSAQEAERRLKSWCWNPYFTICTQKPLQAPPLCLKLQGAALTTWRALPCPPPQPGDKIPHASKGCPAQALLLFYCALFLVLLLLKYSPHEILVNDLNASSLHH